MKTNSFVKMITLINLFIILLCFVSAMFFGQKHIKFIGEYENVVKSIDKIKMSAEDISKVNEDMQTTLKEFKDEWEDLKNNYLDKNEFESILDDFALTLDYLYAHSKIVSKTLRQLQIIETDNRFDKVKDKSELFSIYAWDKNATSIAKKFYVDVDPMSNLQDKIEKIADRLSLFVFRKQINLVKIKQVEDGKRIAVIDLVDSKNKKRTWQNSFEGSTGGGFTTAILIKSFLQPDYSGNWIDGVEFLYNGSPFVDADHTHLSGTKFK